MNTVTGLHHVTAISGPAQENLDFYAGILGMRLVKKSVNQDDPGTYHLFYADAAGHPGTDLTFFPWTQLAPSRDGYGLSTEVSLTVPRDSLRYWSDRFARYGVEAGAGERRFGQHALPLIDPHGLRLALVEGEGAAGPDFLPWDESPVEVPRQIRGLESARLTERDLAATGKFLTERMGFSHVGTEGEWQRFAVNGGGSGRYVDVRETPSGSRGHWGTGSIHHLAWRVNDEAHQLALSEQISKAVGRVTPVIDRFWFKSVYFPEPGGVLFELATDGPGFAVDEDPARLGETLVLPPWLEGDRAKIEQALPKLTPPSSGQA